MAYRLLENIDEKILDAVIKIGAKDGAKNVTARKIAKVCDISTFTVFEHFKSKTGYLFAAAKRFDTYYMNMLPELSTMGNNKFEIWTYMQNCFLSDPDSTLYYISYINDYGFDPTSKNPRESEFMEAAKCFLGDVDKLSNDQILIIWDYVTTMAFYYAEKIIQGYLRLDDNLRKFIFDLVFEGVNNLNKPQ